MAGVELDLGSQKCYDPFLSSLRLPSAHLHSPSVDGCSLVHVTGTAPLLTWVCVTGLATSGN